MKSQVLKKASLVFALLLPCLGLTTIPENQKGLSQKIQQKDFTVLVNYANPLRGTQIYLTSEYDLKIRNDSAFAFLPYFGVAFSESYGGDGGIKFAEPMINYSIKNKKKSDGWDIRFKVKARESVYEISMDIYNNGSSTISVNTFNRDMITFLGEVNGTNK